MGPHPRDWIPKTDLEITEEVLREQNNSRSTTYLSSIGVSSASKRSTVSAGRIRELEDKISTQEQDSLNAAQRVQREMEERMQEQERKFEELRRKQDDELQAVKKASEENRLAFEKRQKEMDGMLGYLLRMSQNSQSQSP
jgi:TolA-binding protein